MVSISIQSTSKASADRVAGVDAALQLFGSNKDMEKKQVDFGGSNADGGATRKDFGLKMYIRE